MALYEEPFDDPARLARDWIVAPGMAIRNGVLSFAPDWNEGFCVGRTRRHDFSDFALTVDVRIVRSAVAMVLRAVGPQEYYMVQFDIANNSNVVWFHTFTPAVDEGYRLDLVPSDHIPREGEWYRMKTVAEGNTFTVSLGRPDGMLQPCATWIDQHNTYTQGAVGLWEHGGEAGEYRALRVEQA
ncbi:MAG TPA: hypothetical protein VJ717_07235 [Gemmatimonadaceae bacterium]|nr:hypothetical protein [Gemmatimonadaceae bacterium]